MSISQRRNIAIIAHVDHGKTTLVDRLLQQSGTLGDRFGPVERVMDSNDIERERGITILSKNTAINWKDNRNDDNFRINIVDTPGHADFGGEVERVLSMVDSVLLLVDAVEGPMPQTRFVTQKAFSHGLKPIVVINKIDRDGARPEWVLDQTFDLFDRLGASDEQLDFPVIYASAIEGFATLDSDKRTEDMSPLFQTIVDKVSPPDVDVEGEFQMQVSSLDYSKYVGTIGVGRITRGQISQKSPVVAIDRFGKARNGRILQLFGFRGLEKVEIESAQAGDIIALTGIENLGISDTICSPAQADALPSLSVDEPTVSMNFQVNTSPFAGKEGKYVTSRQIGDRLRRELIHNVALRVEETEDPDVFAVSGRGELHLSILLENMRREGYEIAVSRPHVIFQTIDDVVCEPWEELSVDVEDKNQGAVMEALGTRSGNLKNMQPDGKGRVRLEYSIPARGLIGFQTEFMTLTSGSGLLYHVFEKYAPLAGSVQSQRHNGALISTSTGKALAFALFNLQERGRLFINPNVEVYEGQIIGLHSRDNDLIVNPLKGKQLTNVRASGKDDSIVLEPPIRLSLESAIEVISDDELVEITPKSIRVRKKLLKEHERKQASRLRKSA
ncbi:MAG: translational GTPase TypA [Gammaproteobacteria bacterium]|nr:translational GTPase TypA [Gammaproteobacteria bacterium]